MTNQELMNALFEKIDQVHSELKTEISSTKVEMSEVKEDITGMKTEMSEVKKDITGMKTEISEVKEDISGMKIEMSEVREDITGLKTDMSAVKGGIRLLNMTIENYIKPQINIIAEGHLNLNRKLDDALKIEYKKEIMKLKLLHIENEIEKLKNENSITA